MVKLVLGGKSELQVGARWVTPSRGNARESATENIPPRIASPREGDLADGSRGGFCWRRRPFWGVVRGKGEKVG